MKLLVTGAGGFVGRHVTRALVARGHDVLALCRPARSTAVQDALGFALPVVEDPGRAATLAQLLGDAGIDAIFHLAGRLDPDPGIDDIDAVVEANVSFPARLLAAASESVPNVVVVSTGTIWAHAPGPGPAAPSIYGATKRAYDEISGYYRAVRGIDARTIILPSVYGSEQPKRTILALLVAAVMGGDALEATSGTAVVDLVHIDDVVDGLVLALDANLGSGRWALSSGEAIALRDLASLLGRLAGKPVPVRWGAVPDRPHQLTSLLHAAPLLPGWAPRRSLDEGLRCLLHGQATARAGTRPD